MVAYDAKDFVRVPLVQCWLFSDTI